MFNITQKLHNIFRVILCATIGSYLVLLTVVNISPSQRFIASQASNILSEKLGAPVSIEELQIGLFNRLIFNNISIFDKNGEEIICAKRLTAKLELRSLIKKQISLRTVSLLDANINLHRDRKGAPLNIQFIIDAFSSKKKTKNNPLNLRINSLILRRVNLNYNVDSEKESPAILNSSRLGFSNITANISIKNLRQDSINVRVRSFAFKEKSGFTIDQAQFNLQANREKASITGLKIKLPESRLSQDKLCAKYNARSSWLNLWKTLCLQGSLNNCHLATNDFKSLHPFIKKLDLKVLFNSDFKIEPSHWIINNIAIQDIQKKLIVSGNVECALSQGGSQPSVHYTLKYGYMNHELSSTLAKEFSNDTTLTKVISRIGNIVLSGNGTYSRQGTNSGTFRLNTDQGSAGIKAQWNSTGGKGHYVLDKIKLASITLIPHVPSSITIHGKTSFKIKNDSINKIKTDIKFDEILWKDNLFKNITAGLEYSPNRVISNIDSPNPNINIRLKSLIQLTQGKLNEISLQSDIQDLCPQQLGIKTPYADASFSGKVHLSLFQKGKDKIPYGKIHLTDFAMHNGPQGDYSLQNLYINRIKSKDSLEHLSVRSDFLDLDVLGKLSPLEITKGVKTILHRSLTSPSTNTDIQIYKDGKWEFQAILKNTDFFWKMLNAPIDLGGPAYFNGVLDSDIGNSNISLYANKIQYGNIEIFKPSMFFRGSNDEYNCLIKFQKAFSGKMMDFLVNSKTSRSSLHTTVKWNGLEKSKYSGVFKCSTNFSLENKPIKIQTNIFESQFMLADSLWNISKGIVNLMGNNIELRNIGISHKNQNLSVNGKISTSNNDSILANIKNINIDYLLGLINFNAVDFGGLASGIAKIKNTSSHPVVEAKLRIPDFTFNSGKMGKTDINASWNNIQNKIFLDAYMQLDSMKQASTTVNGDISIAEKALDLHINAKKTDLHFLRRYMDGIFSDFQGTATGSVNLYGPFKKLDFRGNLTAQAEAKIISTGVRYKLHDGKVILSPGVFDFKNFIIQDEFKGKGKVNGKLTHKHLKNLCYDFDIQADRLLCYDLPENQDMPFYSTTTGSGSVHLQGSPGQFVGDIILTPVSPTFLVYSLGTPDALGTDNDLIHFQTHQSATHKSTGNEGRTNIPESTTDIKLNFLIDCNSSAKIKIITDPRAGDAITAFGSGPIRASFHNKGNFEMYGTYKLNRGTYKLSIQDIIRKDLILKPESKITFSGNPMQADLALQAVYTINGVSLSDLNYGAGFSQKSAKVDCLLNITGKTQTPKVSFDLDLHNISEDEKQMVRQLIATDEDMNRQVIYLLGIGRFYAANAQGSIGQHNTQDQSAAAMRSFISTTLTSQLNNAISSALGNQSHWTFGTNLAPGTLGWEDVEVDGLLQGRLLNDRLLINGNFGYRDRPTYASNFVGDFDIRYILTPKGSVSLRAYSETTDRYFTKSSMTTQGVGIKLKRDFNKFRDLFQWKKKGKTSIKNKDKESQKQDK